MVNCDILIIGISCILVYGQIQHVHTAETLYDFDDPIVQLGASNLTSTVIGSDVAWIVEFYSIWCGHCQRFAPVWVELATKVEAWQSVIRVAAIACSNPRNAPICRSYNIWGYPTVKFFPRNAGSNHKGNPYEGEKTVNALISGMIDYLDRARSYNNRIQLNAVRSLDEARAKSRASTRILFLVAVQNTGVGKQTARAAILDMSSYYPEIVVVWSIPSVLTRYGIDEYPSVHRVTARGLTRINSKGEMVAIMKRQSFQTTPIMGMTTAMTTLQMSTTTSRPAITPTYVPPDGVHSQDMDSGVYYSFWVEVASQGRIFGSKLTALKRYVHIMARHYSGSTHVHKFIKRVHGWLSTVRNPIGGKEWVRNITSLQRQNAYVPQSQEWTGCKGSSDRFRGYPCSLWMIFHSLTVNAYLTEDNNRYNPRHVLVTMREYISNFFGCTHCARHFAAMGANIQREVIRPRDGVLWLWKAHNKVNNRLHGDSTEDPSHTKIQFPAPSVCSDCRRTKGGRYNPNVTWHEQRVFNYLIDFYRSENVVNDSKPSEFNPLSGFNSEHVSGNSCRINNTRWSDCSKTCGVGVSTRLSNNNPDCEVKIQFRLCRLRSCNARLLSGEVMSDVCDNSRPSTFQGSKKTRIIYGNCRSVERYKWRYCGHCSNKCCRPVSEQTITIPMECRERRRVYQTEADVMKINLCRCRETC